MEDVDHLYLLDIVEMDAVKNVPQGYQSENVVYGKSGFVRVGKVPLSTKYLDKFVPPVSSFLFMNKEKAVPADQINKLDHSLIFIKPTDVIFHEVSTVKGGSQVRSTFMYGQISYDLPITDVDFLNHFAENPRNDAHPENVYFTISLGLEFQGLHYKLIAGVICF